MALRFSLLIAVEQQGISESKCKYDTAGLEYFCKLDWKFKYNKKISLRFVSNISNPFLNP